MNYETAEIRQQFAQQGYIVDEDLAATLGLMQSLQRPLLVEGEAGVGKTEIAKALARATDSLLIRLQCFDGLDTNSAVYEWNYTKQLISIKLHESSTQDDEINVFKEEFLMERPLLQSIRQDQPAVLLVDEIDRADEAFEAYLLELLSDFQITVPELGTIKAKSIPRVVLTSNGTRELSYALRRRCLYHYLDYPDMAKELAIINSRLPGIQQKLAGQIVSFMQLLRQLELVKRPGVAETLDWAAALMGMETENLINNPNAVTATRSCILKTRDDFEQVDREMVVELFKKIA